MSDVSANKNIEVLTTAELMELRGGNLVGIGLGYLLSLGTLLMNAQNAVSARKSALSLYLVSIMPALALGRPYTYHSHRRSPASTP